VGDALDGQSALPPGAEAALEEEGLAQSQLAGSLGDEGAGGLLGLVTVDDDGEIVRRGLERLEDVDARAGAHLAGAGDAPSAGLVFHGGPRVDEAGRLRQEGGGALETDLRREV